MKKIAIYVPTLDSGGAEKQAVLLASLLSIKNEVHLITLDLSNRESTQNLNMIENSTVIRHILPYNVFRNVKQLIRIFKENKIEVLFNYLTFPNIVGCYAGRKAGVSKIYNGVRNSELPLLKLIMERYVHNNWCTKTVFNCYSGADNLIAEGFQADKCLVIPNCFANINPVIIRTRKNTKNIITVGRFVAQKDYQTAIRTISYLKSKRNDFVFHIVGYGKLETQIRAWVKKYGIEDNTIIHIKPSNIPELLENADIYLSTSLFEGTSNSIMEALNFSLPVVCTNVGDNSHLVLDNQNGYLHTVGSSDSMSTSLNKLLDNIELRNQYGKRGNQILKDNFSTETFLKKYSELI